MTSVKTIIKGSLEHVNFHNKHDEVSVWVTEATSVTLFKSKIGDKPVTEIDRGGIDVILLS